jgi:hypothetical protein
MHKYTFPTFLTPGATGATGASTFVSYARALNTNNDLTDPTRMKRIMRRTKKPGYMSNKVLEDFILKGRRAIMAVKVNQRIPLEKI